MNAAELLADCQIMSRDFSSRAFQPIHWMRLLNDANEYAATIARKADHSYLIRTFTISGSIPTGLTFLPDDIAAIVDVRFVRASDGSFIHPTPVSALGDISNVRSDLPRYRPIGTQIAFKGGYVQADNITRTEVEYQRSAQPLFRARFASGGAGASSATPTIEKIPDGVPDAGVLNEPLVVRTDALVGVSLEVTSGAALGLRRNVTAQTGAIPTLDSGFTGAVTSDTLAVVPPWPEDVHPFLAVKAVHTAFAAENNPRGTQAIGAALVSWEERFRRAIEARVEGRRQEILDVDDTPTYW